MFVELLSELDLGNEMTRLIVIISFFTIVATVLIAFIFRDYGWVKYLVGFIFIIIGVIKFIVILGDLFADYNLGKLMSIIILGLIGVVSLSTSAIFSIIAPKRRKKRRPRRKIEKTQAP